MRPLLRLLLPALAICLLAMAGARAQALGPFCGKGDASVPGLYTLHGVMEVGSQLLIRKDGSFEFYLAYGANDQVGKGCWTQKDDIVALFPAGKTRIGQHTPDTRGFDGIILRKDGHDLVWQIPGSHYTGRYKK